MLGFFCLTISLFGWIGLSGCNAGGTLKGGNKEKKPKEDKMSCTCTEEPEVKKCRKCKGSKVWKKESCPYCGGTGEGEVKVRIIKDPHCTVHGKNWSLLEAASPKNPMKGSGNEMAKKILPFMLIGLALAGCWYRYHGVDKTRRVAINQTVGYTLVALIGTGMVIFVGWAFWPRQPPKPPDMPSHG